MRRVVVGVVLLLCALVRLAAQQGGLSLQANPTLQIPLGPTLSEEIRYYTIGGGFSLTGEYAFPSVPMFSADAALQFEYIPLNEVGTGLLAFYGGVGAGVRDGDWKLLEFFEDGHYELYNLAEDLSETKDLSKEMPEKVAELAEKLHAWEERMMARLIPLSVPQRLKQTLTRCPLRKNGRRSTPAPDTSR